MKSWGKECGSGKGEEVVRDMGCVAATPALRDGAAVCGATAAAICGSCMRAGVGVGGEGRSCAAG